LCEQVDGATGLPVLAGRGHGRNGAEFILLPTRAEVEEFAEWAGQKVRYRRYADRLKAVLWSCAAEAETRLPESTSDHRPDDAGRDKYIGWMQAVFGRAFSIAISTACSGWREQNHIMRNESQTQLRCAVIEKLVNVACEHSGISNLIDRDRAVRIAEELYDEVAERERLPSELQLTDEVFDARRDALIFFELVSWGWGTTVRLSSGAVKAVNSPLSFNQRLGYPSSYRIWQASRRVRLACPAETLAYKRAYRAWREARIRYLACESEESFGRYCRRVGYYSRVARTRTGGIEHFHRRLYRYMSHQLLPRPEERERALREMLTADAQMTLMRSRIFDALGVPDALRRP
jgi:hypothetical protein